MKDLETNRTEQGTSPYLIYKVVNKEPVNICLYIGDEEQKKMSYKDFGAQVAFVLDAWTVDIANMIKKISPDMEKNFNDFIQGASITKNINLADYYTDTVSMDLFGGDESDWRFIIPYDMDGYPCDLVVIYDYRLCEYKDTGQSYFSSQPFPKICLNTNAYTKNDSDVVGNKFMADRKAAWAYLSKSGIQQKSSASTLLHEMGHAFGLGDQYDAGLWNNDVLYSTIKPRKSVMRCDSSVFTCDDIDGMVSLFYRVKKQSITFKSFCKDGLIIKDGMPVLVKPEEKIVPNHDDSGIAKVYTITPDSAKTGKYATNERQVQYVGSLKDKGIRNNLTSFGYDISYFTGKGDNSYYDFAPSDDLPDGQYRVILNAGDSNQAQGLICKIDENNNFVPVSKPINLIKVTDPKTGKTTYQNAPVKK